MQPEKNSKNDLDYLSELGFEKVHVKNADFSDLEKRIRSKNSAFKKYLVLAGLLVLASVGPFVLFNLPKTPSDNPSLKSANPNDTKFSKAGSSENKVIYLDTITVVKENFINPSPKKNHATEVKETSEGAITESADIIETKPLDLSLLSQNGIKEEKLKYMINSPVFYLHDMKVSDYTTLYFKKNHFVKYTGISAAYSNISEATPTQTNLKQEADYYLHEEIAKAMLHFKKGRYDQAINSLKTVSSYNETDINCDFYLAMCYYYKKNYDKSVELYDDCIVNRNNTFLQESLYYKALALYESNKREDAKKIFRKISEENEFYAQKARSFLKE